MQDEVNQKTVAFIVSGSKMTASVLRQVLMKYLQENQRIATQRKQQKQMKKSTAYKGKMSLRKLVSTSNGVSDIEIKNGNIRDFERIARKYGIEYALKKDNTVKPPNYIVFFRGKDADVLNQAFKAYVQKQKLRKAQPTIKQRLEKAKEILKSIVPKAKTKSKEKAL